MAGGRKREREIAKERRGERENKKDGEEKERQRQRQIRRYERDTIVLYISFRYKDF